MAGVPTSPRPCNSWDLLKCFALGLAVLDHVGYFFFPENFWPRALARPGFPPFLFLVGYAASTRIPVSLIIAALVLSVSDTMSGLPVPPHNIFWTIILARLFLQAVDRGWLRLHPLWPWWLAGLFLIPPTEKIFGYGTLGLIFAIGGRVMRDHEQYQKRDGAYFLSFSMAAYVLWIAATHPMTQNQEYGLMAVATFTCVWLIRFRIRPLFLPAPLCAAVHWTGRHTMILYISHFMAFSWIRYFSGNY